MYHNTSFGRASEHYRSMEIASRVESADPHTLVSIMYGELLICVDVLQAAAARGQVLATNHHAHKARAILLSLQSGLNFDQGGELAPMLSSVYSAISEELNMRIADGDVERMAELRIAIESLVHAWNDIAR
jgi:flagellar secretion chaperone FliS